MKDTPTLSLPSVGQFFKAPRIRRSLTGWFSVKHKPVHEGLYEVRGPGLAQMKRAFVDGRWQYNVQPGDEWRGLDGPPQKIKE